MSQEHCGIKGLYTSAYNFVVFRQQEVNHELSLWKFWKMEKIILPYIYLLNRGKVKIRYSRGKLKLFTRFFHELKISLNGTV